MRVSDICQKNVVIVRPADSVLTAARLMRDQHVGCVIVTAEAAEGSRPLGVLTDRDVTVAVTALNLDAEEVAVGDVMSGEPCTIDGEAGVAAALARMRNTGVRRLPVVDDRGALEGIVSSDDVLRALAGELGELAHIVDREQDEEREKRRVKV